MRFTRSLSAQFLNVSSRDSAKILTLNDPKRHHALSLAMLNELNDELSLGATDYRSLVIQSAGPKVFCAGHDLKELQTVAGTAQHKGKIQTKLVFLDTPTYDLIKQCKNYEKKYLICAKML